MIRRMFAIASAVSLLACAITMIIWLRSYSAGDDLCKADSHRDVEIISQAGQIVYYEEIERRSAAGPSDPQPSESHWEHNAFRHPRRSWAGNESWLERLGIWVAHDQTAAPVPSQPPVEEVTEAIVPDWLVAIAFAILPVIQTAGFVRRSVTARKDRHGLCDSCGYDLRASTARCPECGTVIPVSLNA